MWDRLVWASFDKGRQMEVLMIVPVESMHRDKTSSLQVFATLAHRQAGFCLKQLSAGLLVAGNHC